MLSESSLPYLDRLGLLPTLFIQLRTCDIPARTQVTNVQLDEGCSSAISMHLSQPVLPKCTDELRQQE